MPEQAPPTAPGLAWISGKTLEELAPIEHAGALYFREAFRVKDAKGGETLTPVLVRPPTKLERAKARIAAINFVAKELRKDAAIKNLADAQAAIGADVFEDLDTYAIVCECCFEPNDPAQRAYLLPVLLGTFQMPTVADMFERIEIYQGLIDPRVPEDLSHDEFWTYAKAVARAGNVGPLAVMQGATQRAFVISMARRLVDLETQRLSSLSSATSTPE